MRVLVVDDTEDVRSVLRHSLRLSGIEVEEADGGQAAIERLRSDPLPHVVLLDVQMPHMDGWETLRRIRLDRRTADLPVVMCTVKSRGPDMARGWELGCDGYVSKPFDVLDVPRMLHAVVSMSLDERGALRATSLEAARALA